MIIIIISIKWFWLTPNKAASIWFHPIGLQKPHKACCMGSQSQKISIRRECASPSIGHPFKSEEKTGRIFTREAERDSEQRLKELQEYLASSGPSLHVPHNKHLCLAKFLHINTKPYTHSKPCSKCVWKGFQDIILNMFATKQDRSSPKGAWCGGCIMQWGCFSSAGTEALVKVGRIRESQNTGRLLVNWSWREIAPSNMITTQSTNPS